MKILKILELMKKNSFLSKNFKYLIIAGIGGFIVVGGLFIYLSFFLVNYAANVGKNVNFSYVTKNIPLLSNVQCQDKIQSLFTASSWVNTSISENIIKLKQVCLEKVPTICKTQECADQIPINPKNKGEYI